MKKTKFIVQFQDLPKKESLPENRDLENILHNVTGQKGEKCERNCDCSFGLICHSGVCTDEW
jgi:hypothetical protein